MSTDYLKTIKEIEGLKLHIRDEQATNRVIEQIVVGGKGRLQVVFDFDKTITKHHENGKTHYSSFGLFSQCPSIPKSYSELENTMFEHYFPIEHDPNLSYEEKRKYMEEWWGKCEESMRGLKVSPNELCETAKEKGPSLRDGTKDLFFALHKAEVPVLVFSAGLGDSVEAVLKQANVLLPNVKIISNFIKYDEEGRILGFQDKAIHILNKNEYALKGTEYYELVLNRDNIILLGDALGDAEMANGVPHSSAVLKIGFLYDHSSSSLNAYMKAFDIVSEEDPTMNVVATVLKHVLN